MKIAKLIVLKTKLNSMKYFSAEDENKDQEKLYVNIKNQIIEWESISFTEIKNYCQKTI